MSHEQAFEQHSEESLPLSHRQWQAGDLVEPELATMVENHEVMSNVNQRLGELRVQPFRRTVGDAAAWSATAILLLLCLDPHAGGQEFALPLLPAIWLYNRNLHKLDLTQAALTLQEYDKRWIGPLFEALSWPNRRIRQIVRLKLLNLLPLLTESDALTLSHKHLSAIYAILDEPRDTDLKLAILKAIPLSGDANAIPVVEKLTTTRTVTLGGYRMRRAALVCLPLLREFVRRNRRDAADPAATVQGAALDGQPPLVTQFQQHSVGMPDRVSHLSSFPATSVSPIIEKGSTDPALLPDTMAMPFQKNSTLVKLGAEREKVARPAMRSAFLVADWLFIVPYGLFQTVHSFASHQLLAATVWTAFTAGATQLYRVSLSSKRVAMMRKQAQQRDINAVGLLSEALAWPEQDLQYESASALTVLLPLLKANHASLLSAPQRECLHQVLALRNARTQSDLMVAILKAFQQVGDTAAIPYVEQLANASPRSQQERKVVLEAQECLPYLRLCAGNNTASHSLLRASSMSDTAASDNLLRPARERPETRPEQLLRPSEDDSR